MSDDDNWCPICAEELDITDRSFFPCECGYQICQFCWNRILESNNPTCPACRATYDRQKVSFNAPDHKDIVRMQKDKKQRERHKRQQEFSKRHSSNVRVIQRNLVYVTNLAMAVATEDILRRQEYFGQYGKIIKVVINKNNLYNVNLPDGPSVSAYVTFSSQDDARVCIQAIDGCILKNRVLKASHGTTKYCNQFLKGLQCTNSECMYLHEWGDEKDIVTKEEMSVGCANLLGQPRVTDSNSKHSSHEHHTRDHRSLAQSDGGRPSRPGLPPPPTRVEKPTPAVQPERRSNAWKTSSAPLDAAALNEAEWPAPLSSSSGIPIKSGWGAAKASARSKKAEADPVRETEARPVKEVLTKETNKPKKDHSKPSHKKRRHSDDNSSEARKASPTEGELKVSKEERKAAKSKERGNAKKDTGHDTQTDTKSKSGKDTKHVSKTVEPPTKVSPPSAPIASPAAEPGKTNADWEVPWMSGWSLEESKEAPKSEPQNEREYDPWSEGLVNIILSSQNQPAAPRSQEAVPWDVTSSRSRFDFAREEDSPTAMQRTQPEDADGWRRSTFQQMFPNVNVSFSGSGSGSGSGNQANYPPHQQQQPQQQQQQQQQWEQQNHHPHHHQQQQQQHAHHNPQHGQQIPHQGEPPLSSGLFGMQSWSGFQTNQGYPPQYPPYPMQQQQQQAQQPSQYMPGSGRESALPFADSAIISSGSAIDMKIMQQQQQASAQDYRGGANRNPQNTWITTPSPYRPNANVVNGRGAQPYPGGNAMPPQQPNQYPPKTHSRPPGINTKGYPAAPFAPAVKSDSSQEVLSRLQQNQKAPQKKAEPDIQVRQQRKSRAHNHHGRSQEAGQEIKEIIFDITPAPSVVPAVAEETVNIPEPKSGPVKKTKKQKRKEKKLRQQKLREERAMAKLQAIIDGDEGNEKKHTEGNDNKQAKTEDTTKKTVEKKTAKTHTQDMEKNAEQEKEMEQPHSQGKKKSKNAIRKQKDKERQQQKQAESEEVSNRESIEEQHETAEPVTQVDERTHRLLQDLDEEVNETVEHLLRFCHSCHSAGGNVDPLSLVNVDLLAEAKEILKREQIVLEEGISLGLDDLSDCFGGEEHNESHRDHAEAVAKIVQELGQLKEKTHELSAGIAGLTMAYDKLNEA